MRRSRSKEVHDVVFRVRFGGYDEWQVDLHLDRVERQLADQEPGDFAGDRMLRPAARAPAVNSLPERMPDRLSDRMPERLPERIPRADARADSRALPDACRSRAWPVRAAWARPAFAGAGMAAAANP